MHLRTLRSAMALRLNPRGDLPPPTIQPVTYPQTRKSLFAVEQRNATGRLTSLSLGSKPRTKMCHDWIFTSASNVHVALDRSAFKEYTAFESYVLTLSDYRQVDVSGIGTVELKIKCKPDSRDSHTIVLTDVLHIPSWLCNVFSDIYFNPGHDFEHTWTKLGVQFSQREDGHLRAWGYTENFCSLDRLVLAKRPKDSRSPMLEDKEREVFSVNVTWRHSERKRWQGHLAQKHSRKSSRDFEEVFQVTTTTHFGGGDLRKDQDNAKIGTVTRRATLSEMNANIVKGAPKTRTSSLRVTPSQRNLTKEIA